MTAPYELEDLLEYEAYAKKHIAKLNEENRKLIEQREGLKRALATAKENLDVIHTRIAKDRSAESRLAEAEGLLYEGSADGDSLEYDAADPLADVIASY